MRQAHRKHPFCHRGRNDERARLLGGHACAAAVAAHPSSMTDRVPVLHRYHTDAYPVKRHERQLVGHLEWRFKSGANSAFLLRQAS